MDKKIPIFLALIFFLAISANQGLTFSITNYNTMIKASGSGAGYSKGQWNDLIGDANLFKVNSIDLTGNDKEFEFSISTNFGIPYKDGHYGSELGDFFINTGSSYNYAFNLSALDLDTSENENNSASHGLYNVKSFTKSDYFFGSGYIYGNGYRALDSDGNEIKVDPIVRMNVGTIDPEEPVEFTRSSDGDSTYTYTISGDFNLLNAIDLEWGDNFDVLFATATCANSGMMGTVTTQTPEPGTWLLFGTGLLGLLGFGRKKFLKKT